MSAIQLDVGPRIHGMEHEFQVVGATTWDCELEPGSGSHNLGSGTCEWVPEPSLDPECNKLDPESRKFNLESKKSNSESREWVMGSRVQN